MQTLLNLNANFFDRILQIIKHYNINSVNSLAKDYLGYESPQKLNRLKKEGNNPSFDIISDISNKFEFINLNWLVAGKGDMLIEKENANKVSEPVMAYGKITELKDKLNFDNEQVEILNEYIELKIKEVLNNVELKVK